MGGLEQVAGRLGQWTFAGVGLCVALCSQSCGKADGSDAATGATGGASGSAGSGLGGTTSAAGGTTSAAGGAGAGARAVGEAGSGDADAGEGGANGDAGASVGGSVQGGAAGVSSSGGRSGSGGGITISFGGMGGSPDVGACVSVSIRATPAASVLEFLVDTSASMNDRPQQLAPATKYEMTRDALTQTFADLQEGSGVGMIFFPNAPAPSASGGVCIVREEAVPIAALDATLRAALISALAAELPRGSTPTHDAFRYALETLRASQMQGEKYVVLVTDGAPTYALGCLGDGMSPADPTPLLAETASALSAFGIRTFVVGSPGSEMARTALSQMATQGGTATPGCSDLGPNFCHFDMTSAVDFSSALTAALRAITAAAQSCKYAIPMPANGTPIDFSKINVRIESSAGTSLIAHAPAGAAGCVSGWQVAATGTEIELCPDVCAQVKADPSAAVDVLFGCATIHS